MVIYEDTETDLIHLQDNLLKNFKFRNGERKLTTIIIKKHKRHYLIALLTVAKYFVLYFNNMTCSNAHDFETFFKTSISDAKPYFICSVRFPSRYQIS